MAILDFQSTFLAELPRMYCVIRTTRETYLNIGAITKFSTSRSSKFRFRDLSLFSLFWHLRNI